MKIEVSHRSDIDGLRAIAVLSVIFFHLGYLPNGYFGVDIFFGISGYLITKILYNETIENRLDILQFYLRRIRRIIPLVLFISFTVLIIGLFVMLPDDFENLNQSVFATNIFANNILLLLTTGDYWDVVNKYKPLMHTWSLGIEEQFYLLYPLIFIFSRKQKKIIVPLLFTLTLLSISLFLFSSNESSKFYLIQFRFFELSIGGLGAIFFKNVNIDFRYGIIILFSILSILMIDLPISNDFKLVLIVVSTVGLLVIGNGKEDKWRSLLLENRCMISIGRISFSLYLWHQIVIAYVLYFITDKIKFWDVLIILPIVLGLSLLSFYFIEQPFRSKNKIPEKPLFFVLSLAFILIGSSSYYLYSIGGIVRDVPELEIYKSNNKLNKGSYKRNIHNDYNSKVYDLNKKFMTTDRIKILVIGNSFARDFVNILMESTLRDRFEISYSPSINSCKDINERLDKAEFVFFSELETRQLSSLMRQFCIDTRKIWNVGPKNFGSNNGLFYNRRKNIEYCSQRTDIEPGLLELNNLLKNQWKNKYIDLIGLVVDKDGKVPVFTSDCKFISQDCRHLTHAGAVYFAQKIDFNKFLILENQTPESERGHSQFALKKSH